MKKVGIVILNFKVKELVFKCLKSVKSSTYKNIEIIVIDNNSGDGIEEEITKEKVTFIQSGKNLGYTGNNLGIKKALELGVDYVFILNPDTEIDRRAVEYLVEGLEKNNAQIANPKIYFANSKTIWFAGGIFDLDNVLGSNRGVDQEDQGQFDKEEEIKLATGAALIISKDVFDRIGFLDERYFLYYEDSDFCFRARKANFKIMYLPKAVVWHENAKSTGLGSPLQDYFITRNRMLFASKFLPFRTRFALFREALRNIGNPTRRLALWDFLNGNFGKGSFIKE